MSILCLLGEVIPMDYNLQKVIKLRALEFLLSRLLSKKCKSPIPMSGEERDKQDCYSIYICDRKKEHPQYMVYGLDRQKGEIHVLFLDDKMQYSKQE